MLGTDLKYTGRWLIRQKFSTALVVGMLALGIAANVVVFGLVNGLFLRPFPFANPDRLVYINETAPKWNLDVVGINYPDFVQWRQDARLFDGLALYDDDSFNLVDSAGATRIDGASVTHDFAAVLGVQPILGRMFSAEEDRPKAERVVVIGEGLWRERFGAAQDVVGRALKLNGVSRTIVGVMPAAIRFPGNVQLWVPMAGNPNQTYQSFASMALVLALGGSYGVTSYLVSQRTREIGIRVALGAQGADIVRSVLRASLVIVTVGVAIGIAASLGLARLLADLLFGVPPHDAAILAGAAAVLFALAAAANWLPAHRASRIDPMKSLRLE